MSTLSRPVQAAGLVAWLILCFAASAIGAAASVTAGPFYDQVLRPDWAPPPWVFGPVWTALYALMGVSAWLVWRDRGIRAARVPLALFLVQLALNALWSWLFFGWRLGGPAFVDILVLWGFIMATILTFWRVRALAGVLLIPYLLWVSFAAVLNYSIWQLNPALLGSS